MRVFLSAGEASGDAYAEALVSEMRARDASWTFEGIGGPALASTGARLCADSSNWGAISAVQSITVAPRIAWNYWRCVRAMAAGPAGLFIPIDFGFVNLRLAKFARRKGWKVLYFIPPGSWRRDRQGADLPKVTDAIVTPFPWSAETLSGMGANAHFFGHPIKQLIRMKAPPDVPRRDDLVAVLPGSRKHEIELNLPVIAEAIPGLGSVEFALSRSVDAEWVKSIWQRHAPKRKHDVFSQGDTYGVLKRARAAIVCSGTATLEAALCRCPHVVIYRLSKLMELEVKLIRFKAKHVSLPNIILDRAAVPELIHLQATPEAIRDKLNPLLMDTEAHAAQLAAFDEIDVLLGPDDAISRTADLALGMVGKPEQRRIF